MKSFSEDELVEMNRSGYDCISQKFKASRAVFWPELEYFCDLVKTGDKILDLGCGYGRLIKLFQGSTIDYHGLDHSAELIALAQKEYPSFHFKQGDVRSLPYEDKSFDSVWMIALLHHLNLSATKKALDEAFRVMKDNGKSIITVWQPASGWVKKWRQLNRRSFLKKWGGDAWLYYYYFRPQQLKKMVAEAGLTIIEEGFLKKGKRCNYFIVAYRAPIA